MLLRQLNAQTLEKEIGWFSAVLDRRISLYFEQTKDKSDIREISPPTMEKDTSEYAKIINDYSMGFDERLVLVLALLPHVQPQVLDTFFIRNKNLDRGYTEFGGSGAKSHGGFLPTCETALFLLAGSDLDKRFRVTSIFQADHYFFQANILCIKQQNGDEPVFTGTISVTTDYLSLFTIGITQKPDFSQIFPAKRITTNLSWEDLVLPNPVFLELDMIKTWIKESDTILNQWGLKKSLKPGYRSLFYGPPGTGKTLTASLIGESINADVYRIDLSMVVSKYIGETEKNLENVFSQAENKNWVLFFDEADALFGKRTQTSSSNDRYANQEVSYLLQRIEDFSGIVILATNLKGNIDEAFARRFQSLIYFPLPNTEQRYQLWKNALCENLHLVKEVDLYQLAEEYELSGGAIINITRYAAIRALQHKRKKINNDDLVSGVMKEMRKEGKTISV